MLLLCKVNTDKNTILSQIYTLMYFSGVRDICLIKYWLLYAFVLKKNDLITTQVNVLDLLMILYNIQDVVKVMLR